MKLRLGTAAVTAFELHLLLIYLLEQLLYQ
jgi:hypothetical protein